MKEVEGATAAVGSLFSFFINYREITTLTVIWARQLVSPQASAEAGAGPVAERARADEFDVAVGGACGEASEVAIAVACTSWRPQSGAGADSPEVDTLDETHRMPRMPGGEGGEARGRLTIF